MDGFGLYLRREVARSGKTTCMGIKTTEGQANHLREQRIRRDARAEGAPSVAEVAGWYFVAPLADWEEPARPAPAPVATVAPADEMTADEREQVARWLEAMRADPSKIKVVEGRAGFARDAIARALSGETDRRGQLVATVNTWRRLAVYEAALAAYREEGAA
jgi:hypothetical protein